MLNCVIPPLDPIQVLLNASMNCPHPQPFSLRRRELDLLFPLHLGYRVHTSLLIDLRGSLAPSIPQFWASS